MDELVSRIEAVERMERARQSWQLMDEYHEGVRAGYKLSENLILSLPAKKALTGVRCKDCRYLWNDDNWNNLWCNRLTGTFRVGEEDFCSFGKEREDV